MTAADSYSRRVALRVALCEAAHELADRAADLVSADVDHWADGGEHVDAGRRLAAYAQDVLRLAVAYEHARGRSWATIGEALDVTKQAAQQRFGAHVAAFERAHALHWLAGDACTVDLPDGAVSPAASARRLDAWLARRRDSEPGLASHVDNPPERAVSSYLEPMSTVEHVNMLAASIGVIWDLEKHPDPTAPPVAVLRHGLARRKVQLYERLLSNETACPGSTGTDADQLREVLAEARERLADAAANAGETEPATRPTT